MQRHLADQLPIQMTMLLPLLNISGYEVRQSFVIMSADRQQCIGTDGSNNMILHDDCDWQDHSYTWIWEGDFQLRMVGTRVRNFALFACD